MTRFNNETTSMEMLETITKGLNFSIPDIDLDSSNYNIPQALLDLLAQAPEKITVDDITTPEIGGSKTFDRMMAAFALHLNEELVNGRIVGADYTNAFIQFGTVAMQCAVQFELGRRQQQWEGIKAQIEAITANTNLANAKVQLAIAKAQAYNTKAQYAVTVSQLAVNDANYGLVQQQKDSFQRRDERDTAKILSDSWVAQKGIDEGLTAPAIMTNTNVNNVLTKAVNKVGLNS